MSHIYNNYRAFWIESVSEKEALIIEKAMKSGVVKQRNVVGVITGLMGSGKTTLLYRLFGMAPPGLYSSTGVAEQSFRGTPCDAEQSNRETTHDAEESFQSASCDADNSFRDALHNTVRMSADGSWERISHEDIRKYLAPLIKAGLTEAKVEDLAQSLLTSMSPTPVTNVMHSAACEPSKLLEKSHTSTELVPLVRKASPEEPRDRVLDLIHMIDTGGQPELMEVMPSLIHNANLVMVLVNLKYGLNEQQHAAYYCEGGVKYQHRFSPYTTSERVILKLASTLHAKRSVCKNFRLLVVATHRDCVCSDLEARVEDLNKQLSNLLLPSFQEELYMFATPNKIAFALNLKNPDEHDKAALKVIRDLVSSSNLGSKPFETPASFFAFEQDLIHYSEKVKRDILNIDECLEIGAKLKMSNEMVVAALVLFHCQNTFLYFRQALPNHVFINPHVPLDIVNSIIRFSYKQFQGIPIYFRDQLRDGIITEEMLGHSKISHCFVEHTYEVGDAIKLFCHTFTLAPLQPNDKAVDKKKKRYLMMCLKPAIPEQELKDCLPISTTTVPLVIKFSTGCVPLGCFSCTVSCLISKYGWKVVIENNPLAYNPAHNIALLHDPHLLVDIYLVNFIKYIQIHISSDLTHYPSPANITCSEVRRKIFGSLAKVFERMQLDQTEVEIKPAFFCSCMAQPHHFAEIIKSRLWCTKFKKFSQADPQQLLWMGEDTPSQPDLPELIRLKVPEEIGADYTTFGTLLLDDTNGYFVKNIERSNREVQHIVVSILRDWLTRKPTPVTWDNLIKILTESGLNRLAINIDEYRKRQDVQ